MIFSFQADNILTAGMVFGALVVIGGLLFNATGSDKSSKYETIYDTYICIVV